MIEFNAECGHVLRITEDELGSVVRCAYCGRDVAVPAPNRSRSMHLQAINLDELAEGESPRVEVIAAAPPPAPEPPPRRLVLGLTLVGSSLALILLLVMIMSDGEGSAASPIDQADPVDTARILEPVVQIPSDVEPTTTGRRQDPEPQNLVQTPTSPPRGLLYKQLPPGSGMFIETCDVPVTIFVKPMRGAALPAWPWALASPAATTTGALSMTPGRYSVAVVAQANDLARPIRKAIEADDLSQTNRILGDDASGSTALEGGQVIRMFEAEVHSEEWTIVTAVFYAGNDPVALLDSLPSTLRFGISERQATAAMMFYDMPERWVPEALELLERLGVIVLTMNNGKRMSFQVDLRNGEVTSRTAPPRLLDEPEVEVVNNTPSVVPERKPHRRRQGNPWGSQRGQASKSVSPQGDVLEQLLASLRDASAADQAALLRPFLANGQRHGDWIAGSSDLREKAVRGLDLVAANQLIEPLGRTLLVDPDVDVRLAIIDLLVKTDRVDALTYLQHRLGALPDPVATAEVERERRALQAAQASIRPRSKPRRLTNPWDR
jgi:hypothetical protein